MLLHLIAVALVVGTIAVPLCVLRFVYSFVKKPATRREPVANGGGKSARGVGLQPQSRACGGDLVQSWSFTGIC